MIAFFNKLIATRGQILLFSTEKNKITNLIDFLLEMLNRALANGHNQQSHPLPPKNCRNVIVAAKFI